VSIPNTDLVRERIANLSRVRWSQVKQVLRLRHDDADKIPLLLSRLQYELRQSCPELITDGSRPFRVHWTAMNDNHCEVTVDTRHRVKPTGDVYLDNRQVVLLAIHRALKRTNCRLVDTPTHLSSVK
jgi:Mechanosensitive ion channel